MTDQIQPIQNTFERYNPIIKPVLTTIGAVTIIYITGMNPLLGAAITIAAYCIYQYGAVFFRRFQTIVNAYLTSNNTLPEINGYTKDYDLNFALERVRHLSKELHSQNKKLCLFIGRTPGEPFPGFGQSKPLNEVWVSLDQSKNNNFDTTFIPNKQLHIVMRTDDHINMRRISKLFDKVIIDYSTLKFMGDHPSHMLGKLLRPHQQSQLIIDGFKGGILAHEALREFIPPEFKTVPNHQFFTYEQYRDVRTTMKEKHRQSSIKTTLYKLKKEGYFSNIKLETTTAFPYMYQHKEIDHIKEIFPHFILSGPQPGLWSKPNREEEK